ncbi:RlmE family RNA methyltransferase [Pararhodospirillum photometricum]|uniref:Ribosomal RNA large subunit methyltransferase E n=1 Tax=Pararhodospirillum photometricum DSM 122 TaxID=1150469 RepID=H6SQV7_PARPM|nr:RlmE family RNA methyltransferase [Pararhodospirillum photometricum]CCG07422.1 Ribosomal RNA large subunit methyltransferase J [Pararhodospirillum photometricum DSM 122]
MSSRKPPSSSGRSKGGGVSAPTVARDLTVKVRTARRRSNSSTQWLQRQLNDPYVQEAKRRGLRSRAAFKIMELDDRFHLLRPGLRVVDLGAAPGGWTQVVVERTRLLDGGRGCVVGIDILPWEGVAGAHCLTHDFTADDAPDLLKTALNGPADLVLSDMAAPTTGHRKTDHLRVMALAEMAWDFAESVLAPGGAFCCKVFQGGTEGALLARMKQLCESVRHAKPASSRAESPEVYVIAQGFRGRPDGEEDL